MTEYQNQCDAHVIIIRSLRVFAILFVHHSTTAEGSVWDRRVSGVESAVRMWDQCGVGVGSVWDRCGIGVGSAWDRCGISVGPVWDQYGISV